MAEAVAEGIVERLSTPALQDIREKRDIDELERLKKIVSDVKAMLSDAEESQKVKDVQARDWLGKAKDVIYDADDLLDEFFTNDLQSKVMTRKKLVRSFFSSSNPLSNSIKIDYKKIKEINVKLEAIVTESKSIYSGNHPVVEKDRETLSSFYDVDDVIGREADKEAIIGLLLDSNAKENVSIIPIVGLGGVGKTTLVELLYDDYKIKKHFDLRMWVCVPDNFDVKNIVKDIIGSAALHECINPENLAMYQLKNHLQREINGKKYLLVLDDVWNENNETWLSLKSLLMCGAWGSRILVTTRSEEVAKITGTVPQYMLSAMNSEDSWSLFKQIAFKHGQDSNNLSLLAIGKEIVNKCRGHPLSIRMIGRILYAKRSVLEWQSLKNKLNDALWEANGEFDVSSVLKLSYIHLPSHLRGCFTYCALFPNDHKFDVQTLIYLWMAQGFIRSSDPSQCLEDVGYGYFVNLLRRSFFQEVEKDEWGSIKSCKMHDLMHDLACSVAGTESTSLYLDRGRGFIDQKTRHVSLGNNLNSSREISNLLFEANRTRTILLPNQLSVSYEEKLSKSICDAIISTFTCLRALDLHDLGIVVLPSSLGKLKHLRYLDLSKNSIKMLPSSINKLQNLQTLKLSCCRVLKELPKDIKMLVSLRHLIIDGCDNLTQMPRGLGQLTSLQTLTQFVVSKDGGVSELSNLNNLRGELEILRLQHLKDSPWYANLKGKPDLKVLSLEWDEEADDCEKSLEDLQPHQNLRGLRVRGYRGVKFIPSWLTNIVIFTLFNCPQCEYLPPLHQFPSLKIVQLLGLYTLKYVSDSDGKDEHSEFFPSLTELKLWDCPRLEKWWKSDAIPPFPALSKLEIMCCPNLTSIPPYPHLEEQLILSGTKAKSLLETVMNVAAPQGPITEAASTSFSFFPLSRLRLLRIEGSEELKSLPEEWLRNLTSLERLDISKCSRLVVLSKGIQHLTSLQNLDIRDCESLALCSDEDDAMQWQYLRSLRSLTIRGIPNMSYLPAGLQHVTTLERLKLSNCPSLVVLPDWIGSLASLRRLVISNCHNLASLPQEIRELTSLRRLVIDDCPILLKRCQRETGKDWSKIAHILNIEVNVTYVDSD